MPTIPPSHKPTTRARKHSGHQDQWGRGRGGRPWRRLRDRVMRRDSYLCQECLRNDRLTEAKQVDHIKPLSQGGTDDVNNLEAICMKCHNKKTGIESHV